MLGTLQVSTVKVAFKTILNPENWSFNLQKLSLIRGREQVARPQLLNSYIDTFQNVSKVESPLNTVLIYP